VWVAAEACWGGSARVQAAIMMVIGGGGARMRVAVLQCAVAKGDGGDGLWWAEPMMEAVCMHVWAPRRAVVRTAVLHHQIQ
jgi:hypothetical protein